MNILNAKDIAIFLEEKLFGKNIEINNVSSIINIKKNSLSFISNLAFKDYKSEDSLIIVKKNFEIDKNSSNSYIKVDNPRFSFAKVLNKYFHKMKTPYISKSAIIASNTQIGEKVFIGENVIIENNCKIGNNTILEHNSVILNNSEIGSNCRIGVGAIIGDIGFGTYIDENKNYSLTPHIGGVIIEDYVEIGAKSIVDKGTIENTLIKKFSKLGSNVHIAHNSKIGENCLIAPMAKICGSVNIGDRCFIGANSSVKDGLIIESNSFIGIGSVVTKKVDSNTKVANLGAINLKDLIKIKKKLDY